MLHPTHEVEPPANPARFSSEYGDTLHLSWSEGGNSGYVDIADRGMHIEPYVFEDGTTMTFDEFVFT